MNNEKSIPQHLVSSVLNKRRTKTKKRVSARNLNLKDRLISVNRVTKVVKGGKNLSFAALVVVGDEAGHVGFGTGKAKEVPNAIKKAVESAKKNLIHVPLTQGTLPHEVIGEYGAGKVLIKPAKEGTGVIAGGAVRAVMQSLGVYNVRTKILGSTNSHSVLQATFDGLLRMEGALLTASEDTNMESFEVFFDDQRPVDELSNVMVLKLANLQMPTEKQVLLAELLEKNQEDALKKSEKQQLSELMEIYDKSLLLKSEALSVAVERGLIEPLSK